MKRFVAITLSFIAVFSFSTSAFAMDNINPGEELTYSDSGFVDHLNGGLRSTSIPTTEYHIHYSPYRADLELVGPSWLYTNYYFYCNEDGEFHISYTVYSETNRARMEIGVYDLDEKEFIDIYTTPIAPVDGVSDSFSFTGLDTTHRYAIAFRSYFDGLSRDSLYGTARIEH